ncbi:MAG: ankyrin repeat domain-containing protein [Myxococcota bacterium]
MATALKLALKNKWDKLAERLRRPTFNPEELTESTEFGGHRPIHLAIQAGQTHLVKKLLVLPPHDPVVPLGGHLRARNVRLIHFAAGQSKVAILKAVLRAYPKDLERESEEGYTPAWIAVMTDQSKCLQYLIEQGADLTGRDPDGNTMLLRSAGPSVWIPRRLIRAGVDLDPRDALGRTALMLAAHGNPEIARELIAAGADVDAADHNGYTAADYAFARRNDKLCARLGGPTPKSARGTIPGLF